MLSKNAINVMEKLRLSEETTESDLWNTFGDISMVKKHLKYLEENQYICRLTLDFPGCPIEVIRLTSKGESAIEEADANDKEKIINRGLAIVAIIISALALIISWLAYTNPSI